MSTTWLADLPDIIASCIHESLPGLRECRAVPGPYDLARLLAHGHKAPAVLISLLRVREDEAFADAHYAYTLQMSAFITTKNQMKLPHHVAAAHIAQAVATRVRGTDWNEGRCGEARDVRIEPIVTKDTDKADASLWAVTWMQPCVFEPIDPGAPLPIELYYAAEPEVGAAHEDGYTLAGGEP